MSKLNKTGFKDGNLGSSEVGFGDDQQDNQRRKRRKEKGRNRNRKKEKAREKNRAKRKSDQKYARYSFDFPEDLYLVELITILILNIFFNHLLIIADPGWGK